MASVDKILRIFIRLEDEFSQGLEQAATRLDSFSSTATRVGGVMTAGLTAPIVAIGAAAAQTAIEFESAFAGVAKTVEGTPEQIGALREELEALAVGNGPVSALEDAHVQLFTIAEAAGQLGVQRDQIVSFTEVMAELSMTTDILGDEGARSLAQFANSANFDLSNVRQLGDVIATLGNEMATTESEILRFGQRMGELSSIGFSADEILALGGAMAEIGITAELGSTNFVQGMNSITNAVARGGADLQRIAQTAGMTSQQFATLFGDDASAGLQSFINGLGQLDRAAQLETLEAMGLTGSEVQRVFTQLAGRTEDVARALDSASSAMAGNNALMEEAQRRAETAQGNFNQLNNNLNELRNEIGVHLLPAINGVIDALIPLIQGFSNLPDGMQRNIIMAAALVAALGPVILVIGQMITIVTTLKTAVAAASTAFAGLSVAALPIIALVAAIALAVGLLVMNWDKLKTTVQQIGFILQYFAGQVLQGVRDGINQLGQNIQNFVNNAGQRLEQFGRNAGNSFQQFSENVRQGLQEAPSHFENFMQSVSNTANRIGTVLGGLSRIMVNIGANILQGLINGINDKAQEFVATVRRIAEQGAEAVRRFFDMRSPSKLMEGMGKNVVEGFNKGVEKMGNIGVMTPTVNGSSNPTMSASPALAGGFGSQVVNIYPPMGTPRETYEYIKRELAKDAKKRGAQGA
ncbi:MAG: phage tail tape measure protein [Chloroflexota bacterium]